MAMQEHSASSLEIVARFLAEKTMTKELNFGFGQNTEKKVKNTVAPKLPELKTMIDFEQAKQKVAEQFEFVIAENGTISHLSSPARFDYFYKKVAELYQQSNLERIKELEDGLKDIQYKIKNVENCGVIELTKEKFIIEQAKQLLKCTE